MAITFALLVVLSGSALAETWINAGTGSWHDPANWDRGQIPLATTGALVDNGGTARVGRVGEMADVLFVGQAGTGTLEVINGGTLTLDIGARVGVEAGAVGTVLVRGAGSRWTNAGIGASVFFGDSGRGSLTIDQGGAADIGFVALGVQPGARGEAAVRGGASLAVSSLEVGGSGVGDLVVETGGSVVSSGSVNLARRANSRGTLAVSGANASLVTASGVSVGGPTGSTADLTVTGGGRVGADNLTVALSEGSTGAVAVRGAGSSLEVASFAGFGEAGAASLEVSGGATAALGAARFGVAGVGSATVLVDGPGSSLAADIGMFAGNAQIDILNGATLSSGFGNIAATSRTDTVVNVRGAGSEWNVRDFLQVGEAFDAVVRGELRITDGGTVTSDTGEVGRGNDADGSGALLIGGAGSSWSVSKELRVGWQATGATLRVEGGGRLDSGEASIGSGSGSSGTVTVTDSGSLWEVVGDLTVGRSGEGALAVSDGAIVRTTGGDVVLGRGSNGELRLSGGSEFTTDGTLRLANGMIDVIEGSSLVVGAPNDRPGTDTTTIEDGTVTVRGAGSTWTNVGSLGVGERTNSAGLGELVVEAGGAVTTGGLSVTGQARVSGVGSKITNAGDLGGQGSLLIEAGGVVSSSGEGETRATVGTRRIVVTGSGSELALGGDLESARDSSLRIAGGGVVWAGSSAAGRSSIGGSLSVQGAGSRLEISGTLDKLGDLDASEGGVIRADAIVTDQLNVGAPVGNAPMAAGIVDAPSVQVFGEINFNHTATEADPYHFSRDGTATGGAIQVDNGSGDPTDDGVITVFRAGATVVKDSFKAQQTTIDGGTLIVEGGEGGGLLVGDLSVTAGGKLTGSGQIGTGSEFSSITLTGGVIAPGDGVGTLTLDLAAAEFFGLPGSELRLDGGTIEFELGATSDLIAFTNLAASLKGTGTTLALRMGLGFSYAETYTLFDNVLDSGGAFSFANVTGTDGLHVANVFHNGAGDYQLSFAAVPEPGAWAVLVVALAALAGRRRRVGEGRR